MRERVVGGNISGMFQREETVGLATIRSMNPAASRRIPMWVKVLYTAFVAVLVPYYWHTYGPTNFLYFCDVALLVTLGALWAESPLWVSAPAVGILLPQALWCVDFMGGLIGWPLTGMTDYMFNPTLSLFARGLSFFHFWLPFFLLWAVKRLGYDRRALGTWTGMAWTLLVICYFFMPPPPVPQDNPNLPVNINYVYGLSDTQPQTWLAPGTYFACMMVGLPLLMFLPAHWLLCKLFVPWQEQSSLTKPEAQNSKTGKEKA
jgi:hypothetical protein